MQADEYLEGKDLKRFQKLWVNLYNKVAKDVEKIKSELNVHKQTLNRLLENFLFSKTVMTGTKESWQHILDLRLHRDSQPEFQELAQCIKDAIDSSTPQVLNAGEWHLPYVDSVVAGPNMENVKISVSCCAQVSYRKNDDSPEKALAIYNKLNLTSKDPMNPPHMSPAQHVAVSVDPNLQIQQSQYWSELGSYRNPGFVQYSKLLEFTLK